MTKAIVMQGNISDGYKCIGPFTDFDTAVIWDDERGDGSSWIATLYPSSLLAKSFGGDYELPELVNEVYDTLMCNPGTFQFPLEEIKNQSVDLENGIIYFELFGKVYHITIEETQLHDEEEE
jgi:hypothetical protein